MTHKLSIGGMSCGHCVQAVHKALQQVPGIAVEEVTIGEARIETDDLAGHLEQIRGVLDEEGYPLQDVER